MKQHTTRAAALLLAILFFSLPLVSCRSKGEPLFTYGSHSISDREFTYYLSTYKNAFLSTYTDVKDTPDFYNSTMPDGRTGEEFLFDLAVENVSMTLICMELFDQNGLRFSNSIPDAIDAEIDDLIKEYAGGSKQSLNSTLSAYGINVDILRDIYLEQEKTTAVYDYLYGDNGTIGVTDEEREAYCADHYVHVRHLYINNQYYYPQREDGYSQRTENGELVMAPLPEEEAAAKNALVAEVEEALANGEDFDAVYERYSEDQYYENGYYLTRETDFIDAVTDAAFALEEGEYTKVESDMGVHFILRLPLEERAWENEDNADFFADFESNLRYDTFVAYVKQYLPDVTRDEEKLSSFSVEGAAINYRF